MPEVDPVTIAVLPVKNMAHSPEAVDMRVQATAPKDHS